MIRDSRVSDLLTDKRRGYAKVKEVADYFGVSRSIVYEWISSGQLQAKKFGKKAVRVHLSEIERFEQESEWVYDG